MNLLNKLNRRELLVVGIGALVLIVFLTVLFGIYPLIDKRSRLNRQLASGKIRLTEMVSLQSEYETIAAHKKIMAERAQDRPADFSLFALIDKLAGSTGLKKNIVYMKPYVVGDKEGAPKRSRVELKLKGVTIDQFSRLLYRVENAPELVEVPRISIHKKKAETGFLEIVMQVETIEYLLDSSKKTENDRTRAN